MDSQQNIQQLRAEQREIKPIMNSPNKGIREAAQARYLELGLEIDRELLRQSQRVISIV